jgi:hypothetical protein
VEKSDDIKGYKFSAYRLRPLLIRQKIGRAS